MEERDLKKLIAEAKEIAEALDEFADKYADKLADPDEYLRHSDNGFPYFMEELTEDDLEKGRVRNDKNNM